MNRCNKHVKNAVKAAECLKQTSLSALKTRQTLHHCCLFFYNNILKGGGGGGEGAFCSGGNIQSKKMRDGSETRD